MSGGRAMRWIMRRLRPPEPKPMILMYHRIADELVDPWRLAVSPDRFAEQLQAVRRTRHPLSLTDFVDGLHAGTLPTHAVALTFDDGYVDNLLAAKPRLAVADVPATVFLATGYLDHLHEFWWDELARLILLGDGPPSLTIEVLGSTISFDLSAEPVSDDRDWQAWSRPLTQRQAAYVAIWRAFRPLDEIAREVAMTNIRCAFDNQASWSESSRPMNRQEVRELTKDGLLTIGAHSVTHPALTDLGNAALRSEITKSKLACEELVDSPVRAFAYPYGDHNFDVREAVENAGFAHGCTTSHAPVIKGSSPFSLPRIHVLDWDGDAFDRALREVQ
jgi:peptidoglycan/xylan/chitin deacetylase (PgdA/CDA1 family)